MSKPKSVPHVVIVGGGFGGIHAARGLRRANVRITLIDRRNHHLFQPLLYQVASAALNPSDIAYPIRAIFRRQRNVETILDEAVSVDLGARRLGLRNRTLDYDYLVIASGAKTTYFGHDDWEHHAPGLKSIEDALDIRRRVLLAFEAAERDPKLGPAQTTFVVVGAGPTGVELAGAFVDIARRTLASDFRHIDPRDARVLLLEGGSRVLSTYPPDLSERALQQLQRLGVEVRTSTKVTAIDELGVTVDAGERIEARTVLWTAGVHASGLGAALGVPLDRGGRVIVTPDLAVPGHPEVLVVGDLAAAKQPDGSPVPGVAPAAMQGGKHAARSICRMLAGKPSTPFVYRDKGSLATIGRAAAVAQLGRFHFGGWFAWFLWLAIHVFFLIGFRNRVFVMLSWTWSYLTFQRGARLITGRMREFHDSTPLR